MPKTKYNAASWFFCMHYLELADVMMYQLYMVYSFGHLDVLIFVTSL